MTRIPTLRYTLALSALIGAEVVSAAPPSDEDAVRIADTQVTLRVDRAKGQATVIALDGQRVTAITAAHFLSNDDVDTSVLIQRGDLSVSGRIVAVTRNPSFQLVPGKGTSESAAKSLGVDTAIVVVQADPRTDEQWQVLRAVRAADLTPSPFPASGRQIVPVYIVDQHGTERLVRAGNHLNPKCLAWGRGTYLPQHGDSGAGVFIMRKTPEGELRPLLIGNVSQSDDRGGIASLTYRSARWVAHALGSSAVPSDRAASESGPSRD